VSISEVPSSGNQPVDPARQQEEMSALEAAGFTVSGRGQVVPEFDAQGNQIPGRAAWQLQVADEQRSNVLLMTFTCPAGYPAVPPSIRVSQANGGQLMVGQPNAIQQWHPGRRLVEVANEIRSVIPG
jgi:hypothetical protein